MKDTKRSSVARFPELDAWRGLAFIAMVVFHVFHLSTLYEVADFPYWEGGYRLLARFVQWSFLLLVGISLQLSYQRYQLKNKSFSDFLKRQLQRGLTILGGGLLVSLGTWVVFPEQFIRFGILHFIGSSILLCLVLAPYPKIALFLSPLPYLMSFWTAPQSAASIPWAVLGYRVAHYQAMDHFPFLPWLSLPLLGIFLGSVLFQNYQRRYSFQPADQPGRFRRMVEFCGRNAFKLYLLHGPLLALIMSLIIWSRS